VLRWPGEDDLPFWYALGEVISVGVLLSGLAISLFVRSSILTFALLVPIVAGIVNRVVAARRGVFPPGMRLYWMMGGGPLRTRQYWGAVFRALRKG
jgi:hypothetical protein